MAMTRKQRRALTALESALVGERTLEAVASLFAAPPPAAEPSAARGHKPWGAILFRRMSGVTLLPRIAALVVVAALTAVAVAGHDDVLGTIGMLGIACTLIWVAFTPRRVLTRARADSRPR